MVKKLPGSGIVYRTSRLESIPLAVDMLEKGSLYPPDLLPSPLTSFADLGCNVGYFTCWLAHERGRALKGIMVDANPEVVKETTGYEIGSIPAFGWQPDGFRSFLEASLMSEPSLGTGAGQWGEEILITPQNLIRASRAIVVNLTDRARPVFPG